MNSDGGRFKGLIPIIEDWHAKVILLLVTFGICACVFDKRKNYGEMGFVP